MVSNLSLVYLQGGKVKAHSGIRAHLPNTQHYSFKLGNYPANEHMQSLSPQVRLASITPRRAGLEIILLSSKPASLSNKLNSTLADALLTRCEEEPIVDHTQPKSEIGTKYMLIYIF